MGSLNGIQKEAQADERKKREQAEEAQRLRKAYGIANHWNIPDDIVLLIGGKFEIRGGWNITPTALEPGEVQRQARKLKKEFPEQWEDKDCVEVHRDIAARHIKVLEKHVYPNDEMNPLVLALLNPQWSIIIEHLQADSCEGIEWLNVKK